MAILAMNITSPKKSRRAGCAWVADGAAICRNLQRRASHLCTFAACGIDIAH
jgi:hypothetical protein